MACHSQQEIAEAVGCSQSEVAKSIPNGSFAVWNKSAQPAADHLIDFEPPIYNVWKQEIAAAIGVSQPAVSKMTETFTTLVPRNRSCKSAADHATDFEPPPEPLRWPRTHAEPPD